MKIIDDIKHMIRQIDPSYITEYENNYFANIKIDTVDRCQKFVIINELTTFTYNVTQLRKPLQVPVRIYFCKFAPDYIIQTEHGQTTFSKSTELEKTRQQIRDEIQAEVVFPFIAGLNEKKFAFWTDSNITITYPVTRFNAIEIGVELSATINYYPCFEYDNLLSDKCC